MDANKNVSVSRDGQLLVQGHVFWIVLNNLRKQEKVVAQESMPFQMIHFAQHRSCKMRKTSHIAY